MTKKPKYETLSKIAAALGVPVKALLAAKATKSNLPTAEQLEAVFESLDDPNKQVLFAAAEAMLKNQPKK